MQIKIQLTSYRMTSTNFPYSRMSFNSQVVVVLTVVALVAIVALSA